VWKDPIIDANGNRTPPNNWVSNENLFDNNRSPGIKDNRNICKKKIKLLYNLLDRLQV